ncbi:MFS transporter [Thalassiella azotivora]
MTATTGPTTEPTTAPAPSPTGDRDLRLLLVGQVGSVFGGTLTATATSVVAVVALGAGPRAVAAIAAAALLPALLLGPVAGVLLDRVDRPRRWLVGADLAGAAAVGAAAVAGLTGNLTVPALAVLAAALGCTALVHEGLYFSHLTGLGVRDLGRARGRLQSGELVSGSAAAALAGPVAAAVNAATLFVGGLVTHLLSALCLLRITAPDRREASPTPPGSVRQELADGVRAVRGHPVLAAFVSYVAVSGVALAGVGALRALFLLGTAGMPVALFTVPAVVATLLGAAGALLAPRLMDRGTSARALVTCTLPVGSVALLVLPTAGGSTAWVLTAATIALGVPAFVGALANIGLVTIVAEDVGDRFFARVGALLGTVSTGAGVVGALGAGLLAERVGVRPAITWLVLLDLVAVVLLVVMARRSRGGEPAGRPAANPTRPQATEATEHGGSDAAEAPVAAGAAR